MPRDINISIAKVRRGFSVTAAFVAYGVGPLSNGIWKSQPWCMTIKEAFDGLIYALLTTGIFGWLWPR